METAGKYYLTWRWMSGGVFFIAGTYKIFLPLMSKGTAMLEGLKLAWAHGFHLVEVESDNALLVDILQNG
ncbi:hypothetical protein Gotri_003871 [Gossypium trilobum]|uniref:RNase H type-1 domain-containing protein n=1 Tax=Gossypium trilobum TaxID=34281 RepID=A0A7J9F2V8_9ROSI|nr:hypothetical protein [Gossypium trilobum]